MKVALCLSGHFRTFIKCKDRLFKHLIDIYHPDIFIHTWTELGFSRNYAVSQTFDDEAKKLVEKNKKYGRSEGEFYRNTPEIGTIYECLNPKKIIIEKYKDIEDEIYKLAEKITNKHVYDYPPALVSQLRKINLCNKLKTDYERDNNFVYDVVIRSRPDIVLNDVIKLEELNIIHTPKAHSYNIISDIFAFSTSENMNKYCSLFEKLDEYHDSGKVKFNPHELLKYHLDREELKFSIDEKLSVDLERDKSGIV